MIRGFFFCFSGCPYYSRQPVGTTTTTSTKYREAREYLMLAGFVRLDLTRHAIQGKVFTYLNTQPIVYTYILHQPRLDPTSSSPSRGLSNSHDITFKLDKPISGYFFSWEDPQGLGVCGEDLVVCLHC